MHITNPQSALLSNHEVLLHLRAQDAEYSGADGTGRERPKPPGLNHMLRDGLAYLATPEHPTAALTAAHPARPLTLYHGPHSLFRALAPVYSLNKAEYLQLYNVRPRTLVALELVLEEASARFTDAQMADLLARLAAVFDEEEARIPEGVEGVVMRKVEGKLEGAGRRKKGRRKA